MAAAWVVAALGDEPPLPRTLAGTVTADDWRKVCRLASTGLASPVTSSVGRLFDAVAALCGIRARVNYEGQAAIELEGAAHGPPADAYPMPLAEEPLRLDARTTMQAVLSDVEAGVAAGRVSARFHASLAAATVRACTLLCERGSLDTVVLSGGVFQNRLLLDATRAGLVEHGLRVLVPERLPPGDGGISYGQAAVAASRRRE
jgi:hydrogenase maturation protein HypF